ncbi:MAG: hypothetical protein EBZ98_02465, partial [Actinobacteria bacterium]|nr:hypothetical protein [Actinomycetota bacterium]
MRSETCSPASRRACCTRRITSRAMPSRCKSSVTAKSSTTMPSPPRSEVLPRSPSPVATRRSENSPSKSSIPPATTRPPFIDQSPCLTARITFCVSAPRRGPSAAGVTFSSRLASASTSVRSCTSRTLTSSLINYPDPMKVFDTYGADAMRWYLLSSSILRGADFSVNEAGIRDTVRQTILPLWNSWYFLSLYANAAKVSGTFDASSDNVLDRYVIAKTRALVLSTTAAFERNDLFEACAQVRDFLDVLTNWYIRRSRDRFWSGDHAAINTLHSVLHVVCRVAAPLLPLTTEEIYRGLTGERSVHLAEWPTTEALTADDSLIASMDMARDVCSATLSLRKAHQRRVRLPLASLVVASPDAALLRDFVDVIKDEVNVRDVQLRTDVDALAKRELNVTPAALGP